VDLSRVLVRSAEVLEASVDGDRVLMSGRDFAYFGLVDTGAVVWDRIDGHTSLGELVRALAADFGADEAVVARDVAEFVSALDAAGLLEA
jgi:hypothetical protein